MEKKRIIFSTLLLVVLLIAVYIKVIDTKENKEYREDAIKFKEEYEALNQKQQATSSYKIIKIPEDNPIMYANYEKIEEVITKGTGVIYFGFPECPWCRNAVPVLLEAAEETGVETIYYFNALSIRDKKHLDENGNIVTDEEGTEEYYNLVDKLSDYLGTYEGLNDESLKRLYFPTVVFVKEGQILGLHVSTVESQDDPSQSLNDEQHEELKGIYSGYMLEMLGSICNDHSAEKC